MDDQRTQTPDTPASEVSPGSEIQDEKARRKAYLDTLSPYSKERFYERLRMPLPVLDAIIFLLISGIVVALVLGLR